MLFRKDEYKVLLIGLDNAGKTTILEKIKEEHGAVALPPGRICPTVGLNIGRLELKQCRLLLWDLGGQKSLRPIWDRFVSQAQAVIFVIDSTTPPSHERWQDVKLALLHTLSSPALQDAPLLIYVNKADMPGALACADVLRVLSEDSSLSQFFCNNTAYRVLPSCGLTGQSLGEGLNWLVSYLSLTEGQPT